MRVFKGCLRGLVTHCAGELLGAKNLSPSKNPSRDLSKICLQATGLLPTPSMRSSAPNTCWAALLLLWTLPGFSRARRKEVQWEACLVDGSRSSKRCPSAKKHTLLPLLWPRSGAPVLRSTICCRCSGLEVRMRRRLRVFGIVANWR